MDVHHVCAHEATQWNGPGLDIGEQRLRSLGPDILDTPPIDDLLVLFRRTDQRRSIGDELLGQSVGTGIDNLWRSDLLFDAGVDSRRASGELDGRRAPTSP